MKIWREFFIIILVFGLVWIAFTWSPVDLPDTDITVSKEREKELSDLIFDDLKNDNTFYHDSVVLKIIEPVLNRLIRSVDSPKYEYKLHLINNSRVNAFATLDGHIFIYSGLVKFVSGPEELAGILAHEIGHHENSDLIDKLVGELGINVIMAILTGGDAVMVSEVTRLLLSAGFGRTQEKEADDFAHRVLIRSQLKPARMAHFFTRMKAEEKTYPDELEVIMTHPNSKKRIERALSVKLPDDFKEVSFNLKWKQLVEESL